MGRERPRGSSIKNLFTVATPSIGDDVINSLSIQYFFQVIKKFTTNSIFTLENYELMEDPSFSSKRQKRSVEDAALVSTTSTTNTGDDGGGILALSGGSSSTIRSSFQSVVLEQQLYQLKAELEHERSMRQLDGKMSRQAMERLEKQIELSEKQAKQATMTLDEYRRTSEARINTLRESQDEALQKLRECEIKLLQMEEDMDNDVAETETTMIVFYKNKCEHLQNVLHQKEESEKDYQKELTHWREECRKLTNHPVSSSSAVLASPSAQVQKLLEEAPPEMMKELHRLRLSLAQSQRSERQLLHKTKDMEERNRRLIQEREELRIASQRLPIVQKQLEEVHGKYAKMEAEHQAWLHFGRLLPKVLNIPSSSHMGPPEISTIERAIAQARSRGSDMESQSHNLREDRLRLQSKLETKDSKIHELEKSLSETTMKRNSLEKQLQELQSEIKKSKAQQDVYMREAENLRSLIKTFDGLPLASASESKMGDILKSPTLDTSKRTLAISLETAKNELQVAQSENERLRKQVADNSSELDRVKEKFGKLRDALQTERAKAAEAEQRANAAEALAGKGSFDPEKSRVVHFTGNHPLVETLKEEINVLKRQIEAGGKGPGSSSKSAHHNPDKLNQRLKENFKVSVDLFPFD